MEISPLFLSREWERVLIVGLRTELALAPRHELIQHEMLLEACVALSPVPEVALIDHEQLGVVLLLEQRPEFLDAPQVALVNQDLFILEEPSVVHNNPPTACTCAGIIPEPLETIRGPPAPSF